jgi:hypothetical protein
MTDDELRYSYVKPRLRGTMSLKFAQLKNKARKRGIPCLLTPAKFKELSALPCSYCGGPLPKTGHGVDRVDWTKGYSDDNVAPACSVCNERKRNLEMCGFPLPRVLELMAELQKVSIPNRLKGRNLGGRPKANIT